jgi:hypothetical protein
MSKILILRLKLRASTQREDWSRAAAVCQYARKAGFTDLAISVPSLWDNAGACENEIVEVVRRCMLHMGVDVYWMRDLHPSFTGRTNADLEDYFRRPEYYATMLANVNAEACFLDCASAIDAEVYGGDADDPSTSAKAIMSKAFEWKDLNAFRGAAQLGAEMANAADLVIPWVGGQKPTDGYNLNWVWDALGLYYGTERTYGRTNWFNNVPEHPREFRKLDKFDTQLAIGTRISLSPEQGKSISVAEWLTLNWRVVTGVLHMQFAWIQEDEYEAVLEALAGTST